MATALQHHDCTMTFIQKTDVNQIKSSMFPPLIKKKKKKEKSKSLEP